MVQKMETVFTNEFSKEIYEQTYRMNGETVNDTLLRVAKHIASIESNPEKWTNEFLKVLNNFAFVPGGRITSNAGLNLKGTTMINCFVDGFIGEDQDSMDGILNTLTRQAKILKSEGGYGFCCSIMRPRGAYINGIANDSPGAVRMLDMWDTQSNVITQGSGKKSQNPNAKGKIRKGAQMVTMHVWHPDIEEFITSKQEPGRLTKFNMSVLITDDFVQACKNGKPWHLAFPDYQSHPEEYKQYWDGDINKWVSKGYQVKTYKTFNKAQELMDLIMDSTYNRNEPGVLFIDTVNKLNNLYYCENINATNPCGEQILPIGGVCLLGSINLTQFITNGKIDYQKLESYIPTIIRFLDNVNDLSLVPLDIQKQNMLNKRRIGMGVLGYGSMLMMMKIEYGSPEALQLTDELQSFIANHAYQASALLAKEKGSFPLYDKEKYLKSNFLKSLTQDTINMIEENGIRNSHLLSIQPTGNSSVYANNVSGGLEPIFMPEYVRTSIMPTTPEGLSKPTSIDWINKQCLQSSNVNNWRWIKEGDENLLSTFYDGYTWKIDKNRGLLRETLVEDYAVKYLKANNSWDPQAPYAKTTTQLDVDAHIETMKVFAKYVDSAISKTTNLPQDYSFKDFKSLYMKAYETGTIKGITTYRAGTMTFVLSAPVQQTQTKTRPKELECDIHHINFKKNKYLVLVGLMNGKPFEVFSLKEGPIKLKKSINKGKLVKEGKQYNLETEYVLFENIAKHFERVEESALSRMISCSLRYGADIDYVHDQLMKSEGTVVSFSKSIARALSKYVNADAKVENCPECKAPDGLRFEEGCYKCKDCGYSKCS